MIMNQNLGPIKSFLGNVYTIPAYQREYSWEENELDDFWNDIEALKGLFEKEKNASHFLGQVVIHNDEESGKKFIIDGQQRTTTSMLFLRALQLCYKEIVKKDPSFDAANRKVVNISDNYLGNYDDDEKKLHLTLSANDNEYYINNVILGIPSDKKVKGKKSNERIRFAYSFFYTKIKEKLIKNTEKENKEILDNYLVLFTEHVYLLSLETTKLEEAFIIFETLNARGKGLETSDLLKNHIFQFESKDIDTAQKQWNSMSDNLGKVDTTKYIRAYWNSRNDFTRDKALYRTISNQIKSPRESKELLANLQKYSLYFHDIVSPNECGVIENLKLRKCLQNLQTLKVKTFYPLLLSLFEKDKSEDDILKIALTIEKYYFRNFTICRKNPNTNETFLTSIAKDIFDEKIEDVEEINDRIREGFVADSEFKQNFAIWTGAPANKEIIQYMFRKINYQLDNTQELNNDNMQVNIEHIMPEENQQWPETSEYHDDYLWRLGNLTLLSGKLNRQISNKPFNDKKKLYKESVIALNKELMNYTEWNKLTIEKRQEILADLALKIWDK